MKKTLTHFNFTVEKFKSSVWIQLKNYLLARDSTKTLYVCTHCRPILNENKVPDRCVLNGLYTEPVPEELSNLNALENQFIQRAKCFQTVIRLGTYTGKYLRVHFSPDDIMSTLPDSELYIIVDGQPTKDKVVWQGLVDVDNVKHATELLRDTNWLYKNVNEESVDEAAKKQLKL